MDWWQHLNQKIVQWIIEVYFQLHYAVYRKSNGVLSPVISFDDLPICSILNGQESNVFIARLLEWIRGFAGEMLDICSRSGEFTASNLTLANTSMTLFWPSGSYLTSVMFYDSNDDNIITVNCTSTLTTWFGSVKHRTLLKIFPTIFRPISWPQVKLQIFTFWYKFSPTFTSSTKLFNFLAKSPWFQKFWWHFYCCLLFPEVKFHFEWLEWFVKLH